MQNPTQSPSCCTGTCAQGESIISFILGLFIMGAGFLLQHTKNSDMNIGIDHDTRKVISQSCYGCAGFCFVAALGYYACYKYSTTSQATATPLASHQETIV